MASLFCNDALPDEVLHIIFSKLTVRERKRAKLTCKRWYDVCAGPKLTKEECFRLPYGDIHLLKTPRSYLNLEIDVCYYGGGKGPFEPNFEVIEQQNTFWAQHGDSIKSLTVSNFVESRHRILSKILNHCRNVTHLALYPTDASELRSTIDDNELNIKDVSANMEGLLSLSLHGYNFIEFLREPAFLKFTNSVPNLNRLDLNCSFIKDEGCVTTVLSFIRKQSHTLTELKFHSCDSALDDFFDNVFDCIGPQLTDLSFVSLALDDIECITDYAHKLPNLKNLQLYGVNFIEYGTLSKLSVFKNLEFVSFQNTCLRDEDLVGLARLDNLRGIGICDTENTTSGVVNFFKSKVRPNMIALKLCDVAAYRLEAVLPYVPNLKFLDLTSCEMTSMIAMAIINNCKRLTHLSLTSGKFQPSVQPDVFNRLKSLQELDLSYGFNMEPKHIENLRFDQLRTIHFNDFRMPEEGWKKLVKNCPKLSLVKMGFYDRRDMENFDIIRSTDLFCFLLNGGKPSTMFNFSSN